MNQILVCAVAAHSAACTGTCTHASADTRHQQEEQNEDNQEYDCPLCVTAKYAHE